MVRAYLEDVFNGHNLQSLDKYMTENLVSHWLGDRSLHGQEAWREAMANFFDAFPDAAPVQSVRATRRAVKFVALNPPLTEQWDN